MTYTPCQHKAVVSGYNRRLVFANVEFPEDDPPDEMGIGGYTYVIVKGC